MIRRPPPPRATPPAPASSSSTVADAKRDLLTAVASRPPPPRAALQPALDALAAAPLPDEPYSGVWATLYTDSVGPSSGKIGPIQGQVRQSFDRRGAYTNTVAWPSAALPVLRAELSGTASKPRPGRVDVAFESTAFFVGPFKVGERPFPPGSPGSRGHWRLLYEDYQTRVFESNKGNLFVLGRVE